jgi:hypothetical protein
MQNFHSNINMARQQHPRSSSKRTAKTKKAEKAGKTDFDDFDCVIVERPSHEIDRFGKIREVSNDPGPLQNKSPVPSQPAPKKAPAKKSTEMTEEKRKWLDDYNAQMRAANERRKQREPQS